MERKGKSHAGRVVTTRLTAEERAWLDDLRERKEVGYFVMPNSPSKKRRKVSPIRVPCPLVPGTPEVPPPHIPQKWELEKAALERILDPSRPSRVELLEEDAATSSPPNVNASVELLQSSPSTFFSAENLTLQVLSPGPSTSFTRTAKRPGTTRSRAGRGVTTRLTAKEKARLDDLRDKKEVGYFLMPDAPRSKKRRKVSPVRIPCPLVPGTPEIPPQHIPQKWELEKAAQERNLDPSRPSRVELLEEDAATSPPPNVNASVELLQSSPTTSFFAENLTLQVLSPGPSTSITRTEMETNGISRAGRGGVTTRRRAGRGATTRLTAEERAWLVEQRERIEVGYFLMPDAPPSKKRRKVSPIRLPCPLVPGTPEVPPPHIPQKWELEKAAQERNLDPSRPSKVELLEEDAATSPPPNVNASVELLQSSPTTSLFAENLTLQVLSPGPSTSFTKTEPLIYEDGVAKDILQWEHSLGQNPGSDVEDEDDLDGMNPRQRHCEEYVVEDLPSELCEVLGFMDRQDDCALRELSQENLLTFDWSPDPQVFTGVRENFTGAAGPTFPTEGMSPFQIFSKIWDEDIINLIVNETNKYAEGLTMRRAASSLTKCSQMKRWTPITPQELWTFFGVLMLQSIVPIPVEKEYWQPCLPYLKFGFGDIMPFRRFALIKRCLHFVDNIACASGIPNKLTKIKPVIDHLNNKFSSLYVPEQEIVIDESLILWKGRLSFAQVIANKTAQVGLKSSELCESRTGYLWYIHINAGKDDRHNEANTNEPEVDTVTSKIVLNLVRPLLNRGHTLVMDNFYNSPLLARILKAQKTDVMGTLRRTREFVPDSLRHKNKNNMRPGEVAFSQTQDLTISVWRDTNVVALISTFHKVEVGRKEKYGYHQYKPKVVLDYNLAMGGVDKKDQFLQAFPIERIRNPVWYKKLFRRLLNVSIHNAVVMFQNKCKMTQRQFRLALADEIIKRFRPPIIETPRPTTHFPAKTNIRKSRCKLCALRKVDTCTAYKCEACNVNLCIIGCFKEYHLTKDESLKVTTQ